MITHSGKDSRKMKLRRNQMRINEKCSKFCWSRSILILFAAFSTQSPSYIFHEKKSFQDLCASFKAFYQPVQIIFSHICLDRAHFFFDHENVILIKIIMLVTDYKSTPRRFGRCVPSIQVGMLFIYRGITPFGLADEKISADIFFLIMEDNISIICNESGF